MFHKIFATYI